MDLDPAYIRSGLIVFIILFAGVAFHEWGHAIAADLLGDDTPRAEGRVTLNPLVHMDLVGTVIAPLVNIFIFGGALAFMGWGKPVMTNLSNFKRRWRDDIIVNLAGPAANLLVALVSILVGSLVVVAQPRLGELVNQLVVMNVGLAVFNLLPIPPLDGASILRHFVGISEEAFLGISRWSGIILLLVVNIGVTQNLIIRDVELGCRPYAFLCAWINPMAFRLIFRT
jgi:Zn-dependent protease